MTSGAVPYKSYSENAIFISSSLLLVWSRKIKYIVMMTKEGSIKIVNFMIFHNDMHTDCY